MGKNDIALGPGAEEGLGGGIGVGRDTRPKVEPVAM